MRVLWMVAILVALFGCGSKKEVGGKPIGEPPGYRFVRESDPVGTVIYERGYQWIGSDHAPTLLGKITQLRHVATSGMFKDQEVVSYRIEGSEKDTEDPVSIFYESGLRFVKE